MDMHEKNSLLEIYKGEDLEYDQSLTWLDLFKKCVKKGPDALAVSAYNGTYTYKELDDASDRFARYLLGRGAGRGDFVILKLDRIREFIAAAAGTQKAGCAYIPVDPSYPEDRIRYMTEDSGADIVITADDIEEAFDSESLYDPGNTAISIPGAGSSDTAYMIYTSGSTGRPKGVKILQSSLMNFTLSVSHLLGLTGADRILAYRTFSFDAHIGDFYPALISQASVHIIGEDRRRDPGDIADYIRENNITGGGFTTSVARLLITQYELPMRFITAGGEALYGITGLPSMRIINEYGPTECTNDSTWFELTPGVTYDKVPIGRPMPNMWCFVVDDNNRLLPPGAAGELCVAGRQVGAGYHNLDELTRKVFTECPFIPGERMYHTGDLVRMGEDGLIEYLGRRDNQVKLRGYRIELSEVESVCGRYPGLEETVAAVEEFSGGRHLVLYYTVRDGAVADVARLRDYTDSSTLPDYMKPEFYVRLDEMPRLPNAKIDRLHMPLPEIDLNISNEKPDTALETHMLNVARRMIPGIEFGVTDDLFNLGMTSLTAMKFVAEINSLEFGLKVRVTDVMRYRTIRKLISGNRRVFWNYEEYDPDKPMLVFVYGVATVSRTLQMFKTISRDFNIFVIEQTDGHYDVLFADSTYDDVNDMYLNILENNLPEGCDRIDGFMGFSWGGFISYTLAAAWATKHDEKPFVLMGDTDFTDALSDEPSRLYSLSDFPEDFFEIMGGTITRLEVVKKLNMVSRLNDTVSSVPEYDGKVIQLNALKRQNGEKESIEKQRNLEVIAQYASDFTVIDFPDHTHDDLFYDEEQVQNYIDIMKKAMR